jgi:hypothetical protein
LQDVVDALLPVGNLLFQTGQQPFGDFKQENAGLAKRVKKTGVLVAPDFFRQLVQNLVASCGGVNTSSLLKLARQDRTSGL